MSDHYGHETDHSIIYQLTVQDQKSGVLHQNKYKIQIYKCLSRHIFHIQYMPDVVPTFKPQLDNYRYNNEYFIQPPLFQLTTHSIWQFVMMMKRRVYRTSRAGSRLPC